MSVVLRRAGVMKGLWVTKTANFLSLFIGFFPSLKPAQSSLELLISLSLLPPLFLKYGSSSKRDPLGQIP